MTLVMIDLKVGPQLAPAFSAAIFTAPDTFESGTQIVVGSPGTVVLDARGMGSVVIDPGVWIVDLVVPTGSERKFYRVPDSDVPTNLTDCPEVEPAAVGWAPAALARADAALALAATAREEALKAAGYVEEWIADRRASVPEVAASTTLVLPPGYHQVVRVFGSSDIRAIAVDDHAGHQVSLLFMDASPGRVIDDLLNLPQDFAPRQFDSITLFCDGSEWYELARATKVAASSGDPELPDPELPPIEGAIDGGRGPDVTIVTTLDGGSASSTSTDETTYDGATVTMQIRRQRRSEWETNAYVLGDGELGWSYDSLELKLGDGVTLWTGLTRLPRRGPQGEQGRPGFPGENIMGDQGEDGVRGEPGDQGLPGGGAASLLRLSLLVPVPTSFGRGIVIREGFAAAAPIVTPPPTGGGETPYEPPVVVLPPSGSVIVPQSQRGPSALDYTPKTLPRTQKADREFLSASNSTTDITAACKAALSWMDANPTKWADVILPDGKLYGSGAGSTSTPFLQNIGTATGASGHRIRVRPGGGYGAVEIADARPGAQPTFDANGNLLGTASLRFLNVNGFTMSEIYGNEAGFLIAGCSDFGFEYAHDVGYWAVYAVAGKNDRDIDLTSIVYGRPRVKNGDAAGLSTLSGGYLSEVHLRTMFMNTIRIGPRETWGLRNGVPEKPHSDLIQVKGNTQVPGFTCSNSYLCACANCIFQFGGNTRFDVQDSWLVGGYELLQALFPTDQAFYPPDNPPATFQVFNGDGLGGHSSRRTWANGSMGGASWSNTAEDRATSLAVSGSAPAGWTTNAALKSLAELRSVPIPDGFKMWASR